jgi:hypothetical protein
VLFSTILLHPANGGAAPSGLGAGFVAWQKKALKRYGRSIKK